MTISMEPSGNQGDPGVNPDLDIFDDEDEEDDDESEEGEASSSSNSANQDENDIYPPGFPLSPAEYEINELAEDLADDELSAGRYRDRAQESNQFRELTTLFPFEWLDIDGIWKREKPQDVQLPMGQLRKEMIQNIAASGAGGQWQYVEFAPPWTDPDWSSRFIYTGEDGEDPVNDPLYKMYAKRGYLQTQRPALRDEDARRDLTAAAKRYGVDPTMMDDATYGKSGVTPTQGNFNVQLGDPRVTPSNQGLKNVVDKDDFDAVYGLYRAAVAARGGLATEDDFKRVLGAVAAGTPYPDLGPACDAQIATALLQYMAGLDRLILREEFQQLIFAGSTSNEVCICCARLATQW